MRALCPFPRISPGPRRTGYTSRSLTSNTFRSISTTRPAPITTWTCRQCLNQQAPTKPRALLSYFSTSTSYSVRAVHYTNRPNVRSSRRKKIVLGVLGGTLALGAVWYGPDIPHLVRAVERAGRVATALAFCINDYRVTLKSVGGDPENGDSLLARCHQRCADRTYKVLEKNGSIFIKLGQHLAAMGYLLPTEWTTTFVPLQDKCPVSSYESIQRMIQSDTGSTIADLFEEFDPQPIGAASLAQVHRAKLKETGQEVAVKLQHPALAEWIPLDVALTRFTFSNIKWFFPEYPMEWLSDEIEASLPQELDFEQEAHNIRRVREYFSDIKNAPLVVPNVIWAKSRILVMEYLPGHRLDDLDFIDSNGISRDEVSAALARIFNEMVFGTDAPLHCDPHGGNLAIRVNNDRRKPKNFDIILYDHGLYRDIPTDLRRSYAKLWLAVIDSDEARMRKYAKEVAHIKDDQFHLFASAITGRDYTVLEKSVSTPRSEDEKKAITNAMSNEGMLAQLVQLLADVPSVILLILKTNDLTRSLDESLCTSFVGPERTFMILARYCARTVYKEEMETIWRMGGLLGFGTFMGWLKAIWGYWRIEMKLRVFESLLVLRRRLGLEAKGFGGFSGEVPTPTHASLASIE